MQQMQEIGGDRYLQDVLHEGMPEGEWFDSVELCQLLLDHWKREAPVIELDVSDIHTAAELLETFARILNLKESFGNNLDKFGDALVGTSAMPRKLILRGWQQVVKRMPADANVLMKFLRELGEQYAECAFEIEYA